MTVTPRTDLRSLLHIGASPPSTMPDGDPLVTNVALWWDTTAPAMRMWDGSSWVPDSPADASVLAQATLAPSWSWAVAIDAEAALFADVTAQATLAPSWSWAVAIEAAASVLDAVDSQATLSPSWTWAVAIEAVAAVTADVEAAATLAPAWSWAAAIEAAAEVLSVVDAQATLAPAWSWSVDAEAEAEVGVSADADLAPAWSWAVAIEAAATAGAFSPDDIADLEIWLDADEITGVTDGNDFGTWPNLVAANDDFTEDTDQPSWHANVVNGRAAVRFTRTGSTTGDRMVMEDINPLGGASAGTLFVVSVTADATGTENGHMIDNFGTPTSGSHYPYSDGTIYDTFGTSSRKTISGVAAATVEAWHIYEVVSAPGAWTAWIDGTQIFTTASNSVDWRGFNLRLAFRSRQWGGDIGLILAYGAALSSGDRDDIRNHLASEFGITL